MEFKCFKCKEKGHYNAECPYILDNLVCSYVPIWEYKEKIDYLVTLSILKKWCSCWNES